MQTTKTFAVISAVMATSLFGGIAEARCTKLAFSVNDYGKDGPTKDAQRLLDTYIAKWGADRGIKQLTVGKKETSCELFLDFGVFDEHTCKAAATVCWPGNEDYANKAPTPGADGAVKAAAAKPVAKAAATKTAQKSSPITTGTIPVTAAPTAVKAAAPAPVPAAPVTPTPTAAAAAPPAAAAEPAKAQ
jgi:hypothetical protein